MASSSVAKSVIRDRKANASGRYTNALKSTLLQRLCASAIVGKELVAVGKAQLLHQRRRHWSLSNGDWSTQREGRSEEGKDV